MQCPNCNFYKVDSELIKSATPTGSYPDPQVGNAFLTVVTTIIVWIIGCVVAAIVGFFVAVILDHYMKLGWKFEDADKCAEIFVAVWTIGCLVVGICIVINLLNKKGTHYEIKTHGYSNYCRHCGYTWHS